jgi:hypothetical protein
MILPTKSGNTSSLEADMTAPSPQEAGAVAWRWRFHADDAWHYGPDHPGPFRFGDPDDIEPLYAAAPAPQGMLREAIAAWGAVEEVAFAQRDLGVAVVLFDAVNRSRALLAAKGEGR